MKNLTYFNTENVIDDIEWNSINNHIADEFGYLFEYIWRGCVGDCELTMETINKHKEQIFTYGSIYNLCKHQKLTLEFINENINRMSISDVVSFLYNEVDEAFLRRHVGKYNMSDLIKSRILSNEFIKDHFEEHIKSFVLIATYQHLSDDIVSKYIDAKNYKHWEAIIGGYTILSEAFLENHISNININMYAKTRKLSNGFIDKHVNAFNFNVLEIYQELDECFIRKHINKVNFTNISQYQKLSEEFIKEYAHIVRWDKIVRFQKHLSADFLNDNKDNIKKYIIFSDSHND